MSAHSDKAISLLNALLAEAPDVTHALVETRFLVPTGLLESENPALDDLVLWTEKDGSNPQLGLLGTINGILGQDDKIAAVFDDNEKLIAFSKMGSG